LRVDDADPALADRADGQLGLPRYADLVDHNDVERRAERAGTLSTAGSIADVSFSRTKQTISSRNASQVRVHVFTPRRCFTQGCSEQSTRLSEPISMRLLIRFSKRSKNASS